MGFEQVLTGSAEARANAVACRGQGPANGRPARRGALTGSLRSLFAVVENLPRAQGERERLKLRRS